MFGIPPTISDDKELINLAFKGLGGCWKEMLNTASLQPVEKIKAILYL